MTYLPFVDGMRALAILAVVAFHVRIPGCTGGFVGVDVFFVISGFLIIGQIRRGLEKGSFTFSGFYARRVLRILPPFLLVLLVSAAVAPFVLVLPEQHELLAGAGVAASLISTSTRSRDTSTSLRSTSRCSTRGRFPWRSNSI